MEDVDQLVSLEDAKLHLRISTTTAQIDADVQLKLDAATGIVIDYLKNPDHGWTEATLPAPVHAAILLQLAHLYAYRGDARADRDTGDELAPGVAGVLRRMRDPALA